MLSGYLGLKVKIVNITAEQEIQGFEPGNVQLANVIVGIGSNGTYERSNVPLVEANNILRAIAVDIHGNSLAEEITITHTPLSQDQPRMTIVSGNLQQGLVNNRLNNSIIIEIVNGDGSPFVEKLVTFNVVRSNGRITATEGSEEAGEITKQIITDNQGRAQVWWKLGSDAGCGNNRIEVVSRDIAGNIMFCASAEPEPAKQINIGSGSNQRSETGLPATEPLRVWVSDTCNGVSGVLVTFTVKQGNATINGSSSAIVTTSITGHAETDVILGSIQGNVSRFDLTSFREIKSLLNKSGPFI